MTVPVLGKIRYWNDDRTFLQCIDVEYTHPETGEAYRMVFKADPKFDFGPFVRGCGKEYGLRTWILSVMCKSIDMFDGQYKEAKP